MIEGVGKGAERGPSPLWGEEQGIMVFKIPRTWAGPKKGRAELSHEKEWKAVKKKKNQRNGESEGELGLRGEDHGNPPITVRPPGEEERVQGGLGGGFRNSGKCYSLKGVRGPTITFDKGELPWRRRGMTSQQSMTARQRRPSSR